MNLMVKVGTAVGPAIAAALGDLLSESMEDIKRGMRAGKKRRAIELLKQDTAALEAAFTELLKHMELPTEQQDQDTLRKLLYVYGEATR